MYDRSLHIAKYLFTNMSNMYEKKERAISTTLHKDVSEYKAKTFSICLKKTVFL